MYESKGILHHHALARTRLGRGTGGCDIFYGAKAVDYSGYPDCRPEYVAAFERMANLATKAGVEAHNDAERFRVHAPIIAMSKADIIHLGMALGLDYSQTVSCYQADAQGQACGGDYRGITCLLK